MPIIICLKNDIKYNDKLKISVFNVFLFVEPKGQISNTFIKDLNKFISFIYKFKS